MRKIMTAKNAHFFTLSIDLEIENPMKTHTVAAVTPMAMSVVGHKMR